MIINKIVKQKVEVLKKTHPDLLASINAHFPELPDDEKGKLAGFVIEYVIKSEGNTSIFEDREGLLIDDEEDVLYDKEI